MLEQKCLELIRERDTAVSERTTLRNELQNILSEIQMKDNSIANLNEIIISKESVIYNLQGDN